MGSICLKQGRLSVGSNLLATLPPLGELEGAGAAPLSPPEGGRRVKRGGRDSGAFSQSLLGAAIFLRSVSSWVRLSPFSAAVQDLIFWRCEKDGKWNTDQRRSSRSRGSGFIRPAVIRTIR